MICEMMYKHEMLGIVRKMSSKSRLVKFIRKNEHRKLCLALLRIYNRRDYRACQFIIDNNLILTLDFLVFACRGNLKLAGNSDRAKLLTSIIIENYKDITFQLLLKVLYSLNKRGLLNGQLWN